MRILDLVKNCKRIGISGHVSPDGDCAGSCCGLALFLRKALPEAEVDIYLGTLPESLARNIPGADTIIHEITGEEAGYDAFIILDSIPGRVGDALKFFTQAPVKINIDHHRTNKGAEDTHCYIDAQASSTCELIYEVIDREYIDAGIAKALYVGMVTDTGVFQYSNTAESTMRVAGHLMRFGFDHSAVIREVFFERTYLQAKILGTALVKAELALDGKYIVCSFDRNDMDRLGAQKKDLEGISGQLLLTHGVDCAVLLHETEPGVWRASLRSVQITDVAQIASLFEGGGHTRAAGCTIRTDISAAMETIKGNVAEQLGIPNTL